MGQNRKDTVATAGRNRKEVCTDGKNRKEICSGGGRVRTGGVLCAAAELFDLPPDVVAGLPRLELIGTRQLYLEHHTGLLSYSEERIDANTPAGVVRIGGLRLTLLAMTGEELRVGGTILSVEWVSGAA